MDTFGKVGDFLQRIQAWLWAIGIAIIGMGILRGLAQAIPAASLLLIGVGILVLILGLAAIARRGFATLFQTQKVTGPAKLDLEFHPDRDAMNKMRGGLKAELEGAYV